MKLSTERIQYSEDFISEENIEKNISVIFGEMLPILEHRKYLYERYSRSKENDENVMVALEYYISTIATGYFAGKEPQYKVRKVNEKQKGIIGKIIGKIFGEKNDAEEFQTIIDYITKYNDNASFYYEFIKDYITTGAGYGLLYQNEDEEIVYAHTSSLTSVAIWNYDVPCRKIGLIRCWFENGAKGNIVTHLEIITDSYKKHFIDGKNKKKIDVKADYEFKEDKDDASEVYWNDVPIIAIENPDGLALFENVISLIKKYEQIVKNNSNTFQYNDEAKLKVVGFSPEHDLMIPAENQDGKNGENIKYVMNPAREQEDAMLLQSKVLYVDKDGNIDWIEKNINDTASENHKKTLIDMCLMITGVPNVTDQGFTNADNAAALEKKFFPLDQVLQQLDKLSKKELLRMWEMITARINLKKGKDFDFRDIEIILNRNLPQNNQEIITNWLKLRGLLSDKTIIDHLPFDLDAESELNEIDAQNEENIKKNVENMKNIGQENNSNLNKKNVNQIYEQKEKNKDDKNVLEKNNDKENIDE